MSYYSNFGVNMLAEPDEQGYSPPPIVQADAQYVPGNAPPTPAPASGGIMTGLTSLVGGLVNIFGQRVNGPPHPMLPVQPAMPTWVIPAAVGAGLVALMLVMKRRAPSMAGYRRKHRKSRRR